jgi:ribosomal protein L14E/L6E/L27E
VSKKEKETKKADAPPYRIGQVAESRAGRDADGLYMILKAADADFVWVADGIRRTLAHPKKKRLKHLRLHAVCLEAIADKLADGKKVFDSEVMSALRNIVKEKGKE